MVSPNCKAHSYRNGTLFVYSRISISASDFERTTLPEHVFCVNISGYFLLLSYGDFIQSISSSDMGLKYADRSLWYSGSFLSNCSAFPTSEL